jgi:polysaccharide pyruvyl transferase WcaK-like protein
MNHKPGQGGIHSLTLLGSSSGRNAGDAALMAAIQSAVNAACGRTLRFEIPTIRPHYIREHFPTGAVPISMLPWALSIRMLGWTTWRSILRTDLSLIFDAILFDRALWNPLFNFMSSLHVLLPAAHRRGRRVAAYNVGLGPVRTPTGRRMLKDLLELMEFITLRDEDSHMLLAELGVQNPRVLVTADAALAAPACSEARAEEILQRAGVPWNGNSPRLAVNINRYLDTWAGGDERRWGADRFLNAWARALERVVQDIGARVVFVVTQHADLNITRSLMQRVKSRAAMGVVSNTEYSHTEIKGVLGRVDLLVGMRLHAMILASSECTPICGLAYQPKVHHYYRRIDLPSWSLGFEDFSEEALRRLIRSAWEKRAEIRAHLETVMPRLKRLSQVPAELIAAMDRGEDLDRALARYRTEVNAT